MESDSGIPEEVADGAQVLGLVDSATAENPELHDEIPTEEDSEAAAVDTTGTNGAPTSSNVLDPESSDLAEEEHLADSGNAEAEAEAEADEMDIDETAVGAVPDESAYIGDNCISTPAVTEDNSPQDSEAHLEPLLKEQGILEVPDMAGGDQEESPDQSISSAMPIDSAVSDGAPITQDDESSTMDEEMGGGEGVASSDDVNDISSAAQEPIHSGISSSTAEVGGDISSSDQAEPSLISSTANGPAQLHSLSLPQDASNEFGDADTSEMEGAADTMPTVSDSMPLITMNSNGSDLLSPGLLQEESRAVTSSGSVVAAATTVAATTTGAGAGAGAGGDPSDAAHALATLASAALHHNPQTEPEEKQPQNEEDIWYTVGIVRGTNFTVQNYISDPNVDLSSLSLDNIPDLSNFATTPLEHGTAYRFRVAAVNSCGRGDYSEESAFKTCLPGYPGAPSAIKISKSTEGAHLSWEPPQVAAEGIFEYSVYLAVRSNNQHKQQEASKSQLAFVRVYCGKANTCVVPQSSLSAAHVDSSTKPAIIFRIAARNDKGYGPATQVRWLQDLKSTGVKRAGDSRLPGASPSKQVKQIL